MIRAGRRRRIRLYAGRLGVALLARGPGGRVKVHLTWLGVALLAGLVLLAWRTW